MADALDRYAYTGGFQGHIRLWEATGGEDQEPMIGTDASEAVTCIAAGVRAALPPQLFDADWVHLSARLLVLWQRRLQRAQIQQESG